MTAATFPPRTRKRDNADLSPGISGRSASRRSERAAGSSALARAPHSRRPTPRDSARVARPRRAPRLVVKEPVEHDRSANSGRPRGGHDGAFAVASGAAAADAPAGGGRLAEPASAACDRVVRDERRADAPRRTYFSAGEDADIRSGVMKLIDERRSTRTEIDLTDESARSASTHRAIGSRIGASSRSTTGSARRGKQRAGSGEGRLCAPRSGASVAAWKRGLRNRVVQTRMASDSVTTAASRTSPTRQS